MYQGQIKGLLSNLKVKIHPFKDHINLMSLVLLAIGTFLCTLGGVMIKKIHDCNDDTQEILPDECSTPAYKQSTNIALVIFGCLSLFSGVAGLLYSCLSNYPNIRRIIFAGTPNIDNTINVEEPLLERRKQDDSPIMESMSSEEYNRTLNAHIINNFSSFGANSSINLSTISLHESKVKAPRKFTLIDILKEKLWGQSIGLTDKWDASLGEADKSIYYSASEEDSRKSKETEVVNYFIEKATRTNETRIPTGFEGYVKLLANENKNRGVYNLPSYVPPSSFGIE
jgi:hypothetical protein